MNPALTIERFALDSSTLKSVGYAAGRLVVEFVNGSIFLYPDVPEATFEAFAQSESRGKFYNREIKGKFTGVKLTGQCAACGSAPELIGETCRDCGVGIGREIEKRFTE